MRHSPLECREARTAAVGEHAKDVFGVQLEVADEVNLAFPEGQTVVWVAVEGASSCGSVVDSVVEAAVVEAVEEMYSLGTGRKRGADVLGVVREAVDIEVIVGSKVVVNGVAQAES